MPKRVVEIGNCDVDHSQIRLLIEHEFSAIVARCHDGDEALRELAKSPADLVLVNRVLDRDQSDGLEVIRSIKADPRFGHMPCMLLTNFPEFQQAAVAAGAELGFGKAALNDRATRDKLAQFLS